MTANPFAALLRDVPRYDGYWTFDPDGDVVRLSDVLAALAAAYPADLAEAGKVLEGVTPGPWTHDGELWNLIVWDGNGNRVCFMAHSNGLDDARDVATARFIAWCREGVPAILARVAAQEAQMKGLEAERDEYRTEAQKHRDDALEWFNKNHASQTALAAMTKERDEIADRNKENSRLAEDNAQGLREAETALAAERAKVAKLVDALRLIELIGYRECEDFGWINAHMRGVATSALTGESIEHYWRLFPKHRAAITEVGQ